MKVEHRALAGKQCSREDEMQELTADLAASALAPCFQGGLGPGAAGEEAPSARLGGWAATGEPLLTPARGLSLLSWLPGNPLGG